MSLDFHPNQDDLICSCDGDGEIRYWNIKNGSCARVFKVETRSCWFMHFINYVSLGGVWTFLENSNFLHFN